MALWETWQPHLIWLDLQISASIDALRQICALGGNLHPVILAIGDAEAQSIAQATGCNNFLVHPLHETQVRLTLKNYLTQCAT